MILDRITASEAGAILEGRHYLGAPHIPPVVHCVATRHRDALIVFSHPIAASFRKCFDFALEVARLWRAEDAVFPLTHFLGSALRWLRKTAPETDCVLSYADPAAGHEGTIYKAASFTFLHKTTRATDHWELPDGRMLSAPQVYRQLLTKDRKQIAELREDWKLMEGVPKLLFVYPMRLSVEEVRERLAAKLPDEQARRLFGAKGYGGFRASYYRERFPPLRCAHCDREFVASRRDAKTCSASCRTMLSRKRSR
jgi:hypothetical protein